VSTNTTEKGQRKRTKKAIRAKAARAAEKKRERKLGTGKAAEKYVRGDANTHKDVKDLKLKRELRVQEKRTRQATTKAARGEILLSQTAGTLTAEGNAKTWQFSQASIVENLNVRAAKKVLNLKLGQFGPYNVAFARNGQAALLAGRKGHIAQLNWTKQSIKAEYHLNETVRDAVFLHDHTMLAVAQKQYVYIYDATGMELHCIRSHIEPNRLDFLPYHFLLTSIGKTGYLKYHDTSTGEIVAELRTRLGDCDVMRANQHNGVVCLGHKNGTVTMWAPNVSTPLVKMLTHTAPVQSVCVDASGTHLVTAGQDGQVKVWDCRTYKELHSYYAHRPASTMDISQNGHLALAFGPNVQVWKDALRQKAQSPYLFERYAGDVVRSVRFCPYEDTLGVGHSGGFATMVVPGAGEANFDSRAANPFETKEQRRDGVVRRLMEKLQPDMIGLDPTAIGTVEKSSAKEIEAATKAARVAREEAAKAKQPLDEHGNVAEKNRKRGRSKSSKRFRRKKTNIIDKVEAARKETIVKIHKERKRAKHDDKLAKSGKARSALDRFGI
jgi:U3 small nucleolar RNA-associated protein 7